MLPPATQVLPCIAGIGLRAPHYREVLQNLPELGWVEMYSNNFLAEAPRCTFCSRCASTTPSACTVSAWV